jgi:hypothetical protein
VTTVSSSLSPPSRTGSRRRGKKGAQQVEGEYLDEALASFSGYLAVDELYDGPFCVLLAVDPHQQRRLLYAVLDHDPSRLDILLFLVRLNEQIHKRGHVVLGITTDASSLYPLPIRLAFGPILHQICEFHIKKELLKVVLRIVARWRKRLDEQKPKLPPARRSSGVSRNCMSIGTCSSAITCKPRNVPCCCASPERIAGCACCVA